MFEIGFWELVVCALVALWVLGPEQLPVIIKIAQRYILKIKRSYDEIKREVMK